MRTELQKSRVEVDNDLSNDLYKYLTQLIQK